MKIEDRVNAGIRFLDEKYKEAWRMKIDLKTLDLQGPNSCVLGQTDSGYTDHKNMLGLSDQKAYDLGFDVWVPDKSIRNLSDAFFKYRYLTRAWKKALRKKA